MDLENREISDLVIFGSMIWKKKPVYNWIIYLLETTEMELNPLLGIEAWWSLKMDTKGN